MLVRIALACCSMEVWRRTNVLMLGWVSLCAVFVLFLFPRSTGASEESYREDIVAASAVSYKQRDEVSPFAALRGTWSSLRGSCYQVRGQGQQYTWSGGKSSMNLFYCCFSHFCVEPTCAGRTSFVTQDALRNGIPCIAFR